MFKINLVPEVQEKKQKTNKVNKTVVSIAIGSVIVTGVTLFVIGGIIATNKIIITTTNKNIEETQVKMRKYAELEKTVLSLEQGLNEAKAILSGDNVWTKLLPHIEAATPNDVTYKKLSLEPDKITASLIGKDVNALARFVSNYKGYTVLALSGVTDPNAPVTIDVNGHPTTLNSELDGTFKYTLKVNPNDNFIATVKTSSNNVTINYDSTTKIITSNGGGISADIKPLFSNITVEQYTKEDKVQFDATLNFDGGLLW